jgi:multidrug resistance protein MdtO
MVGFSLQFAAVSAAAAWVATSSPRLAYFGRQMALAYYLTMFQGWGPGESLIASRDRLVGILFGLIAMWLVYDIGTRALFNKPVPIENAGPALPN